MTHLLNESQLSKILKISARTLQTWRLRGDGPSFLKIGRSIRYREVDVLDWMNSRCFRSTTEVIQHESLSN